MQLVVFALKLLHLTESKFWFFVKESACPCGIVWAMCSTPVSEKLRPCRGNPFHMAVWRVPLLRTS
jgi:hypothetical protein